MGGGGGCLLVLSVFLVMEVCIIMNTWWWKVSYEWQTGTVLSRQLVVGTNIYSERKKMSANL